MNPSDFAKLLDGREYPFDLTRTENEQAKASGLVVVFGASDDLCELRGAIHDEASCYDGGIILFNVNGVVEQPTRDEREVLEKFGCGELWQKNTKSFKAVWGMEEISWTYKVPFDHATFEIKEDGETFCRGFVFRLADVIGGVQ